jgi:hypothetical protein
MAAVRRVPTIAELELQREAAIARAQRYDADANGDTPYARQNRYQAKRALLRATELTERITEMARHKDDEYTAPDTNNNWPWRAWTTLDLAGKRYSRGAVIPDTLIASSANAAKLISSGYIRRLPDPPVKVAPPAPAVVAPPPAAKKDAGPWPPEVMEARAAIRAAAKRRGIDERSALDVIDPDVLRKALNAGAALPRDAVVGAWGGGGGKVQRVGAGTAVSRRPIDDVIDIMLLGPLPLQPQATA